MTCLGYHPNALYKMGERHICAKFNRRACSQHHGHYRMSRKSEESVEQHHICSFVLFCTGVLCAQRYVRNMETSTYPVTF